MDNKRKRGNEEARKRGKEGDGKRDGKTVGRSVCAVINLALMGSHWLNGITPD